MEAWERPKETEGSKETERPEGTKRQEHSAGTIEEAYETEQGLWRPILEELDRLVRRGGNVTAAIDGRCGSGKTWLAGLIQSLFPCNVLHMDDFYLPMHLRPENWRQIPGGNMDFRRIREELLIPLREGRAACYRPYSCARGQLGEGAVLQPAALTVVEGSYSQHPSMGVEYDLRIFLTCSKEVQKERLRLREGDGFAAFEQMWIPMEESYFALFGIETRSWLQVDTSFF